MKNKSVNEYLTEAAEIAGPVKEKMLDYIMTTYGVNMTNFMSERIEKFVEAS